MAEYIDLNNTEVLTEAGENAKLVVEEDGELKRIPASAVGQVKTVNGVEPDESGNVDVSGLPEGVPVIQSATVGQTVVVKAVDESGKPTEWEAVDMSAGGGGAMIVRFTPESDSTVVSDTDIATVCEAMEAGRAVMGYFSLGGAKLMVGNPVEYMSPQTNTAGQIKFRFTSMSTETSMNVIDLLLTNTGVMINNFTIGSTT